MSTSYYGDNPDNIRRAILNGTVKANDAKARFVGRETYVAAGGRIEGDLFATEGDENWIDVDLIETLAASKLETAAAELAWRARCRANLLAKKLDRAKPTPKPGQTIIFDEPMRFSDGSDRSRFEVVANPKGKTPLFRDPESRAICRIPEFRKRAYRIVHAAIVVRDAASG